MLVFQARQMITSSDLSTWNELVVPHPISTYFMRVEGDSMIHTCIYSGDVIVVDRAITATHNKIIVARLGEDFTVKRLQVIKGQ